MDVVGSTTSTPDDSFDHVSEENLTKPSSPEGLNENQIPPVLSTQLVPLFEKNFLTKGLSEPRHLDLLFYQRPI